MKRRKGTYVFSYFKLPGLSANQNHSLGQTEKRGKGSYPKLVPSVYSQDSTNTDYVVKPPTNNGAALPTCINMPLVNT